MSVCLLRARCGCGFTCGFTFLATPRYVPAFSAPLLSSLFSLGRGEISRLRGGDPQTAQMEQCRRLEQCARNHHNSKLAHGRGCFASPNCRKWTDDSHFFVGGKGGRVGRRTPSEGLGTDPRLEGRLGRTFFSCDPLRDGGCAAMRCGATRCEAAAVIADRGREGGRCGMRVEG